MAYDNLPLKSWLRQVGKIRRKIFLKKLKKDLEERGLSQLEVYNGLLQLIATSPCVRLTRSSTLDYSQFRSSESSDRQQDTIDVGNRKSPEAPCSLSVSIDERAAEKAKRVKIDTEIASTMVETPELLDERVGNAAFLVSIPRAAITLNLNSYHGVPSKKNLSPPRTSPEIRLADSSVPDVSSSVDNQNTNEKCDSSTIAKKPKIIEDLTCIEGTILSTTSLKKCVKKAATSPEKSSKISSIPRKISVETTRKKSLGKIAKNSGGTKRRKEFSERTSKSSIGSTRNVRIRKKLRNLFGSEETLTESDEERKLLAKSTPRKRRKESRMSSDSGVFMNELTSDSMTSEIHDKRDDEISSIREDENAICAEELVKSMPLLDSAIRETCNATITPQEELPDSSTNLEEKSSIPPDSSSCDKLTISVEPLNTLNSEFCDPLNVEMDLSNETQISTPTSTTSCLPDGAPTRVAGSFEDLENLVGIDVKKGCHISIQGNRISIQEDAATLDEDTMSCDNDDENALVIDERSIIDDFETAQCVRFDESSNDGNRRIDASAKVKNAKEIPYQTQLHCDQLIPRNSNEEEFVLSNTLDVDLASETTEKKAISSRGKVPSELPNHEENRKDESIDENQNNTSPEVTSDAILSNNLPALPSADKAVSDSVLETPINADDNSTNTLVNETKSPRVMGEELPDSELPIFLVEPQKTKDIPKISKFRVLHPSELGSRWCPTPLNVPQSQLQYSSIPVEPQVSSNPLMAHNVPNPLKTQNVPNPVMTQNVPNSSMTQNVPNPLIAQNVPNPLMTRNFSSSLMTQSSSSSLMHHPSAYQLNTTNQLPLPPMIQTLPPSYQSNSTQQLSSIPQMSEMLPAAVTQTRQPPLYPSIPKPPQRSPAAMLRAPQPSPLDRLQHIVSTTCSSTLGVQDLSYKNSATYHLPERRPPPPPNHTGNAAPCNWYTRPTLSFHQQSSATSVSSNSYQTNNGLSIDNQQSMLAKICNLLLSMTWRRDRFDTELEMYKIFQLRIDYNTKVTQLIPELEKYATMIGTRDRRRIVKSIVQYYEQLIEPGQRMLSLEKVIRMFNEEQLMLMDPPQSSVQQLSGFTELQYQQFKRQLVAYRQLACVLHFQLVAQSEAAAQVERLKSLEAAKPKRTRRKRAGVSQEPIVQPMVVTPPVVQQMNYQQTIENTIEKIFREGIVERNNVPVNVNEGIVDSNNSRVNSIDDIVRERNVDNIAQENVYEIIRQHCVENSRQVNTIESNAGEKTFESNVRDNTIESNIQNETIETNVQNETIETNVQNETIETNIQNETIETNVQNKTIESNLRDKMIETNVEDNGFESNNYDKSIESNIQVEAIEEDEMAPMECSSERSYSSIEDGNPSVLDVLKEFEILDSMTKGRPLKIPISRRNGKASASTKSKKCSKETNLTCPKVSAVTVLNTAASAENSDSPKTKNDEEVTSDPKPTEGIVFNDGIEKNDEIAMKVPAVSEIVEENNETTTQVPAVSEVFEENNETSTKVPEVSEIVEEKNETTTIVPAINEVVEENNETTMKIPAVSEIVETSDGATREVPVITIDDEDDLDFGSIESVSTRRDVEVVETDEFSILEVKSISKDVFNNMGDMIDEITLVDGTDKELTVKNDTAKECANTKNDDSNCFNCGKETSIVCEPCRSAFYCSAKCHEEHWSLIHHLECRRASKESNNLKKKSAKD